ncbi:MAG: YbhB/YbcL family Raf kinase inhibitor-like protein [Candidatus Paracaedibacter sp.]
MGKISLPPLVWVGAPEGTQRLVLIMDDPDVPKTIRGDGIWNHWVLFNIPSSVTVFAENAKDFSGAIQGKNSGGKLGYTGPCLPDR